MTFRTVSHSRRMNGPAISTKAGMSAKGLRKVFHEPLFSSVVAVALSTALAGCANGAATVKPALTVEAAKAAVLAEEQRIASVIPAEYVERQEQLDSAHLLSCRGGAHLWPDQGTIVLKGDPDISSLLARVMEAYEKREQFTVKLGKTFGGAERVTISGEDGANYYLSPTVQGSDIELSSFSPCFMLGPDQWSGGRF